MPTIRPIRKVLIANRGEIAVRIIRTCRELGVRTVAVYSEADRTALHVRLADESWHIGPAPSAESYLRMDRILEVARASGADAVHPGYGFLSENARFVELCEEAGVVFIGPPAAAVRAMGDKTAARALMHEAGVPMAPGTVDAVSDPEEAARIAEDIGFPVLIKAAAGGGGKGMRIVRSRDEFFGAMSAAAREANAAFGDDRVFLEKYIDAPRHIEFQVLADAHGHCVHLFERECSIQRRHQKVIEEAPSSAVSPELRERMGASAVEAAKSCGYVGAGTVEFLLDADGSYYFMEMNTRLQVEHPVTELITGLDLVAQQIRVAEGHALDITQEDLRIDGHAIECRVYAEDPQAGFVPGPGPLYRHAVPSGAGVRVDSGVEEGEEIPIHYDPMISKLIVWGRDREQAISRMTRALEEYEIAGVPTTIGFCRFVMGHEAFTSGAFSTHFVENHFSPDVLALDDPELSRALAVAAALFVDGRRTPASNGAAKDSGAGFSPWRLRRMKDER